MTLAASGLHRAHGGRSAVAGVSLVLRPGALSVVIGPNGAGKSTLLRLLAGLEPPDQGIVQLDGVGVTRMPPRERARRIAHLPQSAPLQWAVRGADVVALGRLPHGATLSHALAPADQRAVDDAMRRTETAVFARRRIDRLSQGERARLLLARVLATDAAVLLLDEPVASLDPAQALAMMQVLVGEARRGKAVAVVMHDLVLAARFADHVVFLKEGLVAAAGAPNDVFEPGPVSAVYGVAVRAVELDGHRLVLPWVDGPGAAP
jgi:iron complex transport system ATP-binding protein